MAKKKQQTQSFSAWESNQPRAVYTDPSRKQDKEAIAPKDYICIPQITEEMKKFKVVIWDVVVHEWLEGTIFEVFLNAINGSLIYVTVLTSRGQKRAYYFDQIMFAKSAFAENKIVA